MENSTDLEVRRTIESTSRYASGWDTAICRSPNRAIEADAIYFMLGWEQRTKANEPT